MREEQKKGSRETKDQGKERLIGNVRGKKKEDHRQCGEGKQEGGM